jgi:hypothetical protein
MEHVVVNAMSSILNDFFFDLIINAQDIVPQSWNHKELLIQ